MVTKALSRLFSWTHNHLVFEVTTRCNLKCSHCYNVWKEVDSLPIKDLPTEQYKLLIKKAVKDSNCRQVTFTGGEPLMRDDLEELVAFAKTLCNEITLITNGTLLTEKRIDSLICAGVTLFELPLNSTKSEVHNKMAGQDGSFEKVTQAAIDIRSSGGTVVFVFVATVLNIEDWQETFELGVALGARGFLFNRYNAGGECHNKPELLMPSLKNLTNALTIANQLSDKYGLGVGISIPIPPCLISPDMFPNINFGFCQAGKKQAYYTIDPIGNVRPCNHSATIIGNILNTPLKNMVKSKQMSSFKKATPLICSQCKRIKVCQGGCKAAAEVCYGSIHEPDPFLKINESQSRPF